MTIDKLTHLTWHTIHTPNKLPEFTNIAYDKAMPIRPHKNLITYTMTNYDIWDKSKYVYVLNIVKRLHFFGVSIDQPEPKFGSTPFLLACVGGNLQLVKYLWSQGANIHTTTHHNENAISIIARRFMDISSRDHVEHMEVLNNLIKAGVNVNTHPAHDWQTPLSVALYTHNVQLVEMLLSAGVQLKWTTQKCIRNECLKLLLDYGATINQCKTLHCSTLEYLDKYKTVQMHKSEFLSADTDAKRMAVMQKINVQTNLSVCEWVTINELSDPNIVLYPDLVITVAGFMIGQTSAMCVGR